MEVADRASAVVFAQKVGIGVAVEIAQPAPLAADDGEREGRKCSTVRVLPPGMDAARRVSLRALRIGGDIARLRLGRRGGRSVFGRMRCCSMMYSPGIAQPTMTDKSAPVSTREGNAPALSSAAGLPGPDGFERPDQHDDIECEIVRIM